MRAMAKQHPDTPLPQDLKVFLTVIRKRSFAAAAEELGQSPAYISKRIGILESTLKTRLLHRTTRRLVLTDDGERTQMWAHRILTDFVDMADDLAQAQTIPRGMLQICSSFGFGRRCVAPAISLLAARHPDLELRLEVFDRNVDIVREGFDLEVRVGEDLPQQHICKLLKKNTRVLCASPDYLERNGKPQSIDDLANHECLVLRERNSPFGIWHLTHEGKQVSVQMGGHLSTNNGEVVLLWARHGAASCCVRCGTHNRTLMRANWCRSCLSIRRKQTSGPFIPPDCPTCQVTSLRRIPGKVPKQRRMSPD